MQAQHWQLQSCGPVASKSIRSVQLGHCQLETTGLRIFRRLDFLVESKVGFSSNPPKSEELFAESTATELSCRFCGIRSLPVFVASVN